MTYVVLYAKFNIMYVKFGTRVEKKIVLNVKFQHWHSIEDTLRNWNPNIFL